MPPWLRSFFNLRCSSQWGNHQVTCGQIGSLGFCFLGATTFTALRLWSALSSRKWKQWRCLGGSVGWLQLRSWSPGLWVWAPYQAHCCQCRACSGSFVLCSLCSSPTHALSLSQKWINITKIMGSFYRSHHLTKGMIIKIY